MEVRAELALINLSSTHEAFTDAEGWIERVKQDNPAIVHGIQSFLRDYPEKTHPATLYLARLSDYFLATRSSLCVAVVQSMTAPQRLYLHEFVERLLGKGNPYNLIPLRTAAFILSMQPFSMELLNRLRGRGIHPVAPTAEAADQMLRSMHLVSAATTRIYVEDSDSGQCWWDAEDVGARQRFSQTWVVLLTNLYDPTLTEDEVKMLLGKCSSTEVRDAMKLAKMDPWRERDQRSVTITEYFSGQEMYDPDIH